MTFALRGRVLVVAVDHKPKTTVNLRRLRNIRENNRVAVLADEYDDHDWSRLWWVRVDGTARILDSDTDRAEPVAWLAAKYAQYQGAPDRRPQGPVIWTDLDTIRGGRSSSGG